MIIAFIIFNWTRNIITPSLWKKDGIKMEIYSFNTRQWFRAAYSVTIFKVSKGKWSGVVVAVYFNTDNWGSHLYLIEPGLKDAFRNQPYFLEEISIYSKVIWKINDSNSLSFRESTQRKKSEKWKPEMGFQLDIVFWILNRVNFIGWINTVLD